MCPRRREIVPCRNALQKANVGAKPYPRWVLLACLSRWQAAPAPQSAKRRPIHRRLHRVRIFLGEEEIFDVSLSTFNVFDKENSRRPPPAQQLRFARCGGCGGHGGGCGCGGHGGGRGHGGLGG